jgi:hypothetical protein
MLLIARYHCSRVYLDLNLAMADKYDAVYANMDGSYRHYKAVAIQ